MVVSVLDTRLLAGLTLPLVLGGLAAIESLVNPSRNLFKAA